uniref:beta-1,4-mannosyl-glycoprotein 4-beta-N-acetylglucosaminyltransferase isoform X1 n=2 Tax=Monopterus albus TaxID=43700 RepID=UPI0009B48A11|nr:beta-1,4-mannosyl-glycoprotein 4-beta-N-acetylglucosaminyltransferase isoform X1 [Monopterus albus]
MAAILHIGLHGKRMCRRKCMWMKMRRHRVFLLCTVGLCVISFLHYYKAILYVSVLRELSAPYPNIKSFIMVTGFFWREKGVATTPLSPAFQEEAQPPQIIRQLPDVNGGGEGEMGNEIMIGEAGNVGNVGLREELAPPQSWEEPEENQMGDTQERAEDQLKRNASHKVQPAGPHLPEGPVTRKKPKVVIPIHHLPDPEESMGDLHTRTHKLEEDKTSYFFKTENGWCFKQGTKEYLQKGANEAAEGPQAGAAVQRKPLELKQDKGDQLFKCMCRPGWHGPHCGVPTMVYHSNLPNKDKLRPRKRPRRVINAINVNHEFDLLHVRFNELAPAVDLFLVCESNFTAYGDKRPLSFLRLLLNGTYNYVRHKILYVFLNHFPEGGRQDGWIADDYLRTFLTRNGMSRVVGVRPDDVFIINDADEIPAHEGILFLKLFDGWTEPFAIHMRKSLYGFFWKQFGSLEVVSGSTVGMLYNVYDGDGIKLRRREYYTMPGFRKYKNMTDNGVMQWSLGSPFHFAGWHCSWCFTPDGIHLKLVSAQNGDFPRWGDYEEKRSLKYIRKLIQTGGWFDGSLQEYPPVDPKEHMYAPKHMLENYDRYRYLLENPYSLPKSGK